MCKHEVDKDLRKPIIMIYLNKIQQRQIFEQSAFLQIVANVDNPEILVQILESYIHQAISFTAAQNPALNQQRENVISNLSIEASMNVCDRKPQQIQQNCLSRTYVKENSKNVTHVKIAYFINQQVAREQNQDPLQYFQNYRHANND